jgi:CubicO group peptidase (beta-lactamase class C family)
MRSGVEEVLTELLEAALRNTGIPGISASVSIQGRRFEVARGIADASTQAPLAVEGRFQLGCLMKLMAGLVASRLIEARVLDLDEPLGRYLPEDFGIVTRSGVCLRHLASHTAGYESPNIADTETAYYFDVAKLTAFLQKTPQTFSPGSVFNYDHSQFVLIGEIIARVTGRSVAELARQWLFDPLGITVGTHAADYDEPRAYVADHAGDPASGCRKMRTVPYCRLWSASLPDLTISPRDLVQLGELLVGARTLPGWPAQSLGRLQEPLVSIPPTGGGPYCEQIPSRFGFACAQYPDGFLGHNGSARGQTIGFRFDPRVRVVMAVAINSWQPHLRDLLLQRISRVLVPHPSEAPRLTCNSAWTLDELQGVYAGGVRGMRIEVTKDGADLSCVAHMPGGAGHIRAVIGHNGEHGPVVRSAPGHLSIGFFREPSSRQACLQLGLNAYRKYAAD